VKALNLLVGEKRSIFKYHKFQIYRFFSFLLFITRGGCPDGVGLIGNFSIISPWSRVMESFIWCFVLTWALAGEFWSDHRAEMY